ncbi:hypothetical protein CspeluHIS016_0211820 [Cutaneotrichosporon spelunceum]|uniref:Peptidase A1 domain-containing protein n=1 Tax=Cutaneotrichosporon spelunceum TaxID=1672016 RepID=A0AAD3TSH3_9TREE|nr:hypothetical protein CspeluHIS016_0211820 [Cutaneotrichosporon spelunceum]
MGMAGVLTLLSAAAAVSASVSLPLSPPRLPEGVNDLAVAQVEQLGVLAKYGYGKRDIGLRSWGYGYTVQVQVGTPPQAFNVMPDTGSFDFWLIGTCDNATECGSASVYHTAASSTFHPTDLAFQAGPYADGGMQRGMWGYDHVRLGQQTVNVSIGVSNETLNWRLAMDGIMGFGRGSTTIDTALWWMSAAADWTEPQFGMHLGRTPGGIGTSQTAAAGDLTLGGVNHALFTGDIEYVPLLKGSQSIHWEVSMRAVVDGFNLGAALPALIDSGTTLVIGPASYVAAFYANLPTHAVSIGGGQYVYKAAPLNTGLNFGGATYMLDDDDMCRVRGSREWYAAQGIELPEDGEWCLGGVTGQGSLKNAGNVDTGAAPMRELDHWIVGNTFMKNVYCVFRADPPAVGFAQLTPEANKKYPQTPSVGRVPVSTGVSVSGAGQRAGQRPAAWLGLVPALGLGLVPALLG